MATSTEVWRKPRRWPRKTAGAGATGLPEFRQGWDSWFGCLEARPVGTSRAARGQPPDPSTLAGVPAECPPRLGRTPGWTQAFQNTVQKKKTSVLQRIQIVLWFCHDRMIGVQITVDKGVHLVFVLISVYSVLISLIPMGRCKWCLWGSAFKDNHALSPPA